MIVVGVLIFVAVIASAFYLSRRLGHQNLPARLLLRVESRERDSHGGAQRVCCLSTDIPLSVAIAPGTIFDGCGLADRVIESVKMKISRLGVGSITVDLGVVVVENGFMDEYIKHLINFDRWTVYDECGS